MRRLSRPPHRSELTFLASLPPRSCNLCPTDAGDPPRSAVVALATRTYLGLLENQELVDGHCRIAPLSHMTSSLEIEEEAWEEIRVSW